MIKFPWYHDCFQIFTKILVKNHPIFVVWSSREVFNGISKDLPFLLF